jgi:hypothetical protein
MLAFLTGYRTYIIAVLIAVFGTLASADWVSVFNDPKAGLALVGSAVLMAVMRSITATAPLQGAAKKEEDHK